MSEATEILFASELYRENVMDFVARFGNGFPDAEAGETTLYDRPKKELAARTMIYGIATALVYHLVGQMEIFQIVDNDIMSAHNALEIVSSELVEGFLKDIGRDAN